MNMCLLIGPQKAPLDAVGHDGTEIEQALRFRRQGHGSRHRYLRINFPIPFAICYLLEMKSIAYSKSAVKTLRRMPANEARRIVDKIAQYASDPRSQANNVKALAGSPYIRLRVGDWRVIMDDRGQVLDILKIGPRGGIYD